MGGGGGVVFIVTNKVVNKADKEMGERSRFSVYLEYNGVGDWSGRYAH